jgi:hypothetical protein
MAVDNIAAEDTASAAPDFVAVAQHLDNEAALEDRLAKLLDQKIEELAAKGLLRPATVAEQPASPVPIPATYKKHYRCDVAPNVTIQELDMSALDRGERPQANPLAGRYITFHLGHLYTADDNVIRQIEHFNQRPKYDASGLETLGGLPEIYEDDGGDIYRCPHNCEFVTASRKSWVAHLRAVHNQQVI